MKRLVARPAGPYGDVIPHCGTHLVGDEYLVHFNAVVVGGTKPIIGREIEVELTFERARELAQQLNAAADRAEGYQRSRDYHHRESSK